MQVTLFPKPDGPTQVYRAGRMIGTLGPRLDVDKQTHRHAQDLGMADATIGTVEQLTGTVLVIRGAQEMEFYRIKG